MSHLGGSKRTGLPRRGAVKEKIFSNLFNGILSLVRPAPESTSGTASPIPNDAQLSGPLDPNSGPLDKSMEVKGS